MHHTVLKSQSKSGPWAELTGFVGTNRGAGFSLRAGLLSHLFDSSHEIHGHLLGITKEHESVVCGKERVGDP